MNSELNPNYQKLLNQNYNLSIEVNFVEHLVSNFDVGRRIHAMKNEVGVKILLDDFYYIRHFVLEGEGIYYNP